MKKILAPLAALAVILASTVAHATHDADEHSANMEKVANYNDGGRYRQGSDLAFWGDRAVLGNYDNPGGFQLLDISDPEAPALISRFVCPGRQADVSIWQDLVFVSVDTPHVDASCGARRTSAAQDARSEGWEGVRIVSIADEANPTQIAAVRTDCGSHTHTLLPDERNDRLLIYVSSYPLANQGDRCNVASHRKISVIEVPLGDPASARVVSTPSVEPAVGCHDITVLMSKKRAAAACITESQIWDLSDPVNPEILSHIPNPPGFNISHSSAWSWDGDTMVLGDELGGAAVSPGCGTKGHAPLGALWFYDTSDPRAPALKGYYSLQQFVPTLLCTAHNFNTVPVRGADVLVTGWYNGGSNVIDFSDPANPQQVGYYIPHDDAGQATSWSSYWYNGYIYSNNFDEDVNSLTAKSRGFDVYRFEDELTAKALRVGHLNPQTQEPLAGDRKPSSKGRKR